MHGSKVRTLYSSSSSMRTVFIARFVWTTSNICSVSFVLTLISFRRCGNTFHMHSDPSFPVVPSPKRHADPVNALFTASFLIGLCHVSNRTFHPSPRQIHRL